MEGVGSSGYLGRIWVLQATCSGQYYCCLSIFFFLILLLFSLKVVFQKFGFVAIQSLDHQALNLFKNSEIVAKYVCLDQKFKEHLLKLKMLIGLIFVACQKSVSYVAFYLS